MKDLILYKAKEIFGGEISYLTLLEKAILKKLPSSVLVYFVQQDDKKYKVKILLKKHGN